MFWTIPSNPSNPVGPYPGPATGATREPGLLDRLRKALQACHDSKRTEQAYVVWIKQFVYLHNLRHPGEMGSEKEALRSAPESYVAFGCGSSKRVFSIPFSDFESWLEGLWTTQKQKDDQHDWHVAIYKTGDQYTLHRNGGQKNSDLTQYVLAKDV